MMACKVGAALRGTCPHERRGTRQGPFAAERRSLGATETPCKNGLFSGAWA